MPRRHELAFNGDPAAIAAVELGLPVLLPDVQLMRRQRCHYVYGPDGGSLAIHRTIGEALAHILQDYGPDLALLAVAADDRIRYLRLTVHPTTEEPTHG